MIQEQLGEMFKDLKDTRSARNQKHPFFSIIGISLLTVIGAHDSYSGMADFGECHEDELNKFLPLPYGVPSHDTFQRFFAALDPGAFLKSFMKFTQNLSESIKGLTAIDGKAIRNSNLHVVSAWCEENRLVLGHVATSSKGKEIPAIKELLDLLDLKERIISIDAIGCQKDISQQIIDGGGDYVIALKANQKNLLADVKLYFEAFEGQEWQEVDKGHGRIEKRKCQTFAADGWLKTEHKWPGLKSLSKVESTRIIKDKESTDVRYYISSLPPDPEAICKIARRHWSIENKLHWVLDVTFNEDKACIKNDNAAENIDLIRKWALNLINFKKKKNVSIKSIQRKASMSIKYLTNLFMENFHA